MHIRKVLLRRFNWQPALLIAIGIILIAGSATYLQSLTNRTIGLIKQSDHLGTLIVHRPKAVTVAPNNSPAAAATDSSGSQPSGSAVTHTMSNVSTSSDQTADRPTTTVDASQSEQPPTQSPPPKTPTCLLGICLPL